MEIERRDLREECPGGRGCAGGHGDTEVSNGLGHQLADDDTVERLVDGAFRQAVAAPLSRVVQAVLPGMLEAGWGRIVNVTSLTTLGVEERTPYAASKAALETSTRIWARELAQTGMTVNAVAPGPVETEMYFANAVRSDPHASAGC